MRLVPLVCTPGCPSLIGCRDRLAASSLPDARPVSRHHSRASLSGLPGLAVAFLCPSADSLRALRAADLRVTTTAQSRRPWRPGRCPPSAPLFRIVWPFWVLRTHVNVRIGLYLQDGLLWLSGLVLSLQKETWFPDFSESPYP